MDETPEFSIPESIAGPFLRERRAERVRRFRHEGAQVASVVFYEGGGCRVITSDGIEVSSRIRRTARASTVCEIARGRHTTFFSVRLAASGGATFFDTRIQLRWEVVDYELVARKRLRSVEEDLGPEIVDRLQMVSEDFPIQQAQQANRAIRADIRDGRWSDLGAEVGLTTRMFVAVGTDQVYLDEVAGKRSEAAEWERIAGRFAGFSSLAGGPETDRLAWVMASGGSKDVADVIRMMHDDDAQGRADTRDFFLRMLDQGRISSPELEEYLRARVLSDQPAQSPHFALGAGEQAPPRPQLPPAARDADTRDTGWRDSGSDEDAAGRVRQGRSADRPAPEPYRAGPAPQLYRPEPAPDPYRPQSDREPEPYPEPYRSGTGTGTGRRGAEPTDRRPEDTGPWRSADRATGRAANRAADREESGPPPYEQRWYAPEADRAAPPKRTSDPDPDDAWRGDPWDAPAPASAARPEPADWTPYDGGREPRDDGRWTPRDDNPPRRDGDWRSSEETAPRDDNGWTPDDANPPRRSGGWPLSEEDTPHDDSSWAPRDGRSAGSADGDWTSGGGHGSGDGGGWEPRGEPATGRADAWSPRETNVAQADDGGEPRGDRPAARDPEAPGTPWERDGGTDGVRRRRQDHDDYWDAAPADSPGREEEW
jgi:hypothetical protein